VAVEKEGLVQRGKIYRMLIVDSRQVYPASTRIGSKEGLTLTTEPLEHV
jgi:hypothetical protein